MQDEKVDIVVLFPKYEVRSNNIHGYRNGG